MTLIQLFTAIANAIRAKKGTSETITALDFPTEIANISTGKLTNEEYTEANNDANDILENTTVPSGTLSIIENGNYDVTNYAEANVNIESEYNTSIETTFTSGNLTPQSNIKKLPPITIENPNASNMFQNCKYLEEVPPLTFLNGLTSTSYMFQNCEKITEVPFFDTQNVSSFSSMVQGCSKLITIPCYDTSNVTQMGYMVTNCPDLSNESLNNILKMCINATSYTRTKTLKYIGLSSSQATTCQSLSNYQEFLDAGWTTGY